MTGDMADLRRVVVDFWQSAGLAHHGPAAALPMVVAVSGGVDSLVLWHVLSFGGVHPVERLVVATLNHGLRPEGEGDVAFVRSLALAAGATCHTAKVDVPALARDRGQSIEETARVARYAFLADVARATGARHVVVAHHADDQAETVLLHLLRGSGLTGMRGMLPEAPLPGAPDLTLLRPLLAVSRESIAAYAVAHGLVPREDASNADVTVLRNRVRHELMPALASVNPRLRDSLCRLATLVAADEAVLADLASASLADLAVPVPAGAREIRLQLEAWRALPLGLRRRVLRAAVGQLSSAEVGFEALEQARRVAEEGSTGQRSDLPVGVWLEVGAAAFTLRRGAPAEAAALPQLPGPEPLRLELPGSVDLAGGWRLEARSVPDLTASDARARSSEWTVYAALDLEITMLWVRGRGDGERFQPLGLGGRSTTVKKLMNGLGVPAALRPLWPIVATENHPIWIVGQRLDERASLGAGGRTVWRLDCRGPASGRQAVETAAGR